MDNLIKACISIYTSAKLNLKLSAFKKYLNKLLKCNYFSNYCDYNKFYNR